MPTTTYEDLWPGRVIELGTVRVDREEMLAFNRRYDPQPFHVDERAAAASLLGGLCASGWFTAALWMRTYADAVLLDSTSMGSPGGREISWPAPTFPGDLLTARAEVLTTRLSKSRPGVGLVEIAATLDRDTQTVFRAVFTGMFGQRPT